MLSSTKRGVGRTTVALAATVMMASGLGAALAGPASAATASPNQVGIATALAKAPLCPSNYVCVYSEKGFDGGATGLNLASRPADYCEELPAIMNNEISSVINNSDRTLDFYTDAGCKGAYVTVAPWTGLLNLGTFDNTVSSIKL